MLIHTERLELVPLSACQLALWLHDIKRLEGELHCEYRGEPIAGGFCDILRKQLGITEQDADNYMWHSFWLLIRREDRLAIGSADFKDVPDERGETEIGYGLSPEFEHNGYMTEAVRAMCAWALKQNGVRHIIAETERTNAASQRILKRCGFTQYKSADTLWWRL